MRKVVKNTLTALKWRCIGPLRGVHEMRVASEAWPVFLSHYNHFSDERLCHSETSSDGKTPSFQDQGRPYTYIQCLPDLTNSVLTNHPGLTNRFLASNIFLLHNNFGFREFPGLTNNWLGPNRFVKSGRHCTLEYKKGRRCQKPPFPTLGLQGVALTLDFRNPSLPLTSIIFPFNGKPHIQ